MRMAKKSVMADAKDAVKSLAGAALGAAAAGAAGVVAETMKQMLEDGKKAGDTAPGKEKAGASKLAKPIVSDSRKRAPSKKKRKAAKKKVTAVRAAQAKRSVKRRK